MSTSIASSATELFDVLLPGLLQAHEQRAKALGGIYGFSISGLGGGEWTIDLQGEPPSVKKGLHGAQCTVAVAHEDFVGLIKNPSTAMSLFLQGKIKITGNPMLAMKVQKLFELGAARTRSEQAS